MQKLRTEAKQFESKELEALDAHTQRIDTQLVRLHDALAIVRSGDANEAEALGVVQRVLTETGETLRAGFAAWGETLKRNCQATSKGVEEVSKTAFGNVEEALKTMAQLVEGVVKESRAYVEEQLEGVRQAGMLAGEAAAIEIKTLKAQNELLERILEEESRKGERAKDELIQRVSGMLGEFVKERDRGLREAVGIVQTGNVKAEESMRTFERKHGAIVKNMDNKGVAMTAGLDKWSGQGKRTWDGALKVRRVMMLLTQWTKLVSRHWATRGPL